MVQHDKRRVVSKFYLFFNPKIFKSENKSGIRYLNQGIQPGLLDTQNIVLGVYNITEIFF